MAYIFKAGKWDLTEDKLAKLTKIFKARSIKRKDFNKVRGFVNYILYCFGLATSWLQLLKIRAWRELLLYLLIRLPKKWRFKEQDNNINWAVDAAKHDLAIIDEKGRLVFRAQHRCHINWAEALALNKAILEAPPAASIWTDSRVAFFWRKRTRGPNAMAALGSVVAYLKEIEIWWLPTHWNPADQFTRNNETIHQQLNKKELIIQTLFCVQQLLKKTQ